MKNNIIIADTSIIHDAICDHVDSSIETINSDYSNYFESISKIDLLIIDKKIDSQEIPLFRVNSIINLTDSEISKNEINLTKPLKLNELIDLFSRFLKDESIFCCINHNLIYNQRNSTISSCSEMISLTNKENALITLLLSKRNYSSDKEYLRRNLWNYHQDSESSTVETHLYKLKQKLPSGLFRLEKQKCYLQIESLI